MKCPRCGEQYAFFEKTCTRCNVDLVDDDGEPQPTESESPSPAVPDSHAVSVFKTDDAAVLPLATMALDTEGIDYFLKHEGKVDSLGWAMSQSPTNRPVVMEILVANDVAARARDLLADLEHPVPIAPPPDATLPESPPIAEPPSITLEDAVSGIRIGDITESQLQDMTSRLEEDEPQQYFVTGATVDMLHDAGVDAALVTLLREAVGADGSGRVIRWAVR